MEEEAAGEPPMRGEKTGVKRVRSSMEQQGTEVISSPLLGTSQTGAKGMEAAKTGRDVAQPLQPSQRNKEEEKQAGFGPWMVVKKPPRKPPANKQMNGKEKVTAPNNGQTGSRFAVLGDGEDSQESDEIVPNTFVSDEQPNTNKSAGGQKLQGESRKQFQKNLQSVAILANKGNVSGSSSGSNKAKQGPKIAASDKVDKSPVVQLTSTAVVPGKATVYAPIGQDSEPINMDTVSSPSMDGTWCSEPDSLRQVVVDYYRELYSENDISASYHRLPALCSSWKLDPAEKLSLQEDISKEEVKAALFGMHPNKSPGVDGFPAVNFSA
ncbi:hypothetical protein COLO4_16252 [Corchorus olitorius]|uniref:Uncharacterized protein n=1 Tax=Corchorus olitorius TaxID=93759 RepID=A0A1R3JIF3_9ROSI|nr:hypothetical protein COLO4_16252 [Corchorus olitorius]